MRVSQLVWDSSCVWRKAPAALEVAVVDRGAAEFGASVEETDVECADAQLVLVFGSRPALADPRLANDALAALRARAPHAAICACSGSGQILGDEVVDDRLIATAVRLDHGSLIAVSTTQRADEDSATAGARLAEQLPDKGLRYVMVFGDGLRVSGTALVNGMSSRLPTGVTLSGGLAGDDGEFKATVVGLNELPAAGRIVAVGFYGERLAVSHGSLGGFEMFGPNRRVTRSVGNVVYELDGQPALSLYKRYLGSFADELPASAMNFPVCLLPNDRTDGGVVRTVLGVNEADQSLTFAGDVPEGRYVRLTRASREGLVAGAEAAALDARRALGPVEPALVLVVSCVGRRIVLNHRVGEELESARQALGPSGVFAGFYSFGELAPVDQGGASALHNQTMTVTALAER